MLGVLLIVMIFLYIWVVRVIKMFARLMRIVKFIFVHGATAMVADIIYAHKHLFIAIWILVWFAVSLRVRGHISSCDSYFSISGHFNMIQRGSF